MPYRPLVCKIRCANPNKKGSQNANRNYLTYIATRENVDLEKLSENPTDEAVLSAIEKEEKTADSKETSNKDYLKYISDRPGSHGLFGNIDTSDLKKLGSDVAKMTADGKNIYKVIISLSELDAKLLGYTNKNNWNQYLKAVMPDFAKALGLSSYDFTWVAAYHAEKTHPHIHVMLWNNKDIIQSPFIPVATQNKCRKVLSEHMFDENYEKSLKKLLKEERDEYILKKNVSRESITDEFKRIFLDTSYVPGNMVSSLPDKLKDGELKELEAKIRKLVDVLPMQGRISYRFMSPEVKKKIDDITNQLFERRDFKLQVQNYVNASVEIQKMEGKVQKQLVAVRKRAMGELYNRAGNIILKGVTSQIDVIRRNTDAKSNDIEYQPEDGNKEKKQMDLSLEREMDKLLEIATGPDWWAPHEYEKLRRAEEIKSQAFWNEHEYEFYRRLDSKNGNSLYKWGKEYLLDEYFHDPEKAYAFFEKSASNGNKFAMYQLGKMYMKGYEKSGISKDIMKASHWFEESSKLNNHWADYMLGKIYGQEEAVYDIEKSLKYYKKSAEQGNAAAMHQLGYMLYFGNGADIDKEKGIYWLDRAAQENNVYAQYLLGDIYSNGSDENYAPSKAVHMYEKAAAQGNEMAMLKQGQIYIHGLCGEEKISEGEQLLELSLKKIEERLERKTEGKSENAYLEHYLGKFFSSEDSGKFYSMEKAIKYFKLSVEHGGELSLYSLGKIYESKSDIEQALKYYKIAAEKGNEMAMYQLGKLYLKDDVEANPETGMSWLHKAADEYENPYAVYLLGKLYSEQEGEYYNPTEAVKYYEIAAEKGNEAAMYRLGKLYLEDKVEENPESGVSWLHKAADEYKNPYAAYFLGKLYSDQKKEYYNPTEAVKYYELAAGKGNEMAMYQLGRMHMEGKIVHQDYEVGMKWLHEASDSYNNLHAQYFLGNTYFEKGDTDTALKYWQLSADQDNDFAMWRIGHIYLWGIGIDKNPEKGLSWLHKAADEYGNEYAKNEIEMYEKIPLQRLSYGIFKIVFQSLETTAARKSNQYQILYERSRQAKKEQAMYHD